MTAKKHNRLKYGVGINDSDSPTTIEVNGKIITDPYYAKWSGIIQRCYSEKLHIKRPTYIGCTVSDEWLRLSTFKEWMQDQDWQGMHIDKDVIKPGNKMYCADMCCFISHSLNNLLTDDGKKRGMYPKGVSWYTNVNKYAADVRIDGKTNHLGRFDTVVEAHQAYCDAKADHVISVALEQSDHRIMLGLIEHAGRIRRGA